MTTYFRPPFVTEREVAERWVDGASWDNARWEDCTPCAALMLALAQGATAPATTDEAERLRRAAGYGPLGGTYIGKIVDTASARYKVPAATSISGANAVWAALTPGKGAVVAGRMGNFYLGHRLRRHDPEFRGNHAVYVARMDGESRVWWMDPLAPKGYVGEWVTRGELFRFLDGVELAEVAPIKVVPAPTPVPATSWRIAIPANATVKTAVLDSEGKILRWESRVWGSTPSGAPCKAPTRIYSHWGSGSAPVAKATAGVFAGKYVYLGGGVTAVQVS